MQPLYFDVTDVVKFATSHPRVSGIQRVQLNLIAQMARRYGPGAIRCVFLHPTTQQLHAFEPEGVIDESFETGALLRRLGVIKPGSRWPDPASVREYLRPMSNRKAMRTWAKISVYLNALFLPDRLSRKGIELPSAQQRAIRPVALAPLESVPHDATLVLLGTNWGFRRVEQLAQEHAQRGGHLVQMIYDLIPVVTPQFMTAGLTRDFAGWLERVSRYSKHFLCISSHTQADLLRHLGERGTGVQTQVVPLAHEMHGFDRDSRILIPEGKTTDAAAMPYVLCVGTIEIRKNGTALLDAWAALHNTLGERLPRLVFAGRMGWLIEAFQARLAANPVLARLVRLVESPSDEELAYLYQNCLFTAYPSLYEGWGLPVGEAAWFGKYCISSNTSSLPEVCGDLIDYVDPTDPAAFESALLKAMTQPDYVAQREKGLREATLRTWADVAEDLYQSVRLTQPPHLQDRATADSAMRPLSRREV